MSTLCIPVGENVEKVEVVKFDSNDVVAENELKLTKDEHVNEVTHIYLKCLYCNMDYYGALSEDAKDELSIHIGEIHFEPELLAEFNRTFHSDCNKCDECGLIVVGEYVQKERILLRHPWPVLKVTVKEICAGIDEQVQHETIKQEYIGKDKNATDFLTYKNISKK